jgi:choline kinase
MKDTIVSEDAKKYFNENKITSYDWNDYCRKKFNLINGDHVFYEGNVIGYRRVKIKKL